MVFTTEGFFEVAIYIYYHHNGVVAPHALGHMMYRTLCAQVHELPQSHCGDNREGTLFS